MEAKSKAKLPRSRGAGAITEEGAPQAVAAAAGATGSAALDTCEYTTVTMFHAARGRLQRGIEPMQAQGVARRIQSAAKLRSRYRIRWRIANEKEGEKS